MTTVDWWVVSGYVGGLILLGLLMSRRRVAPVDFFLASRGTRWPVIGLAMFASNLSSTALVGLAGGAYAMGIAVYDYEWSATVILVFFAVFMLPSVIASGIYTMPEFLERRYDARSRVLFAVLTLFLTVFVDSAGILYSGSLVCHLLFPTTPLWWVVTLLAAAAGLYAVTGGLRAVLYTEAVQGIVLILGAVSIAATAVHQAGGWQAVVTSAGPRAMRLIRPTTDPNLPWPGLLLGIPLLGFYYWCTNQSMVQRLLSAKNLEHARRGALLTGLLKLPVLFLIVVPGLAALRLFPHLARADLVYPKLMLDLLPVGLVGLVVAGFIAATMVAIASQLNSAATLLTLDVIAHLHPELSTSGKVRAGRLTTAGLLVVAVAFAPQLHSFPSLWEYLQAVLAYAVPPVVAVFLVGMLWRGANATGAVATLLGGTVCGLAFFLCNGVFHWTQLQFLYAAPLLTALDSVILIVVSLRHPAASTTRDGSRALWTLELAPASAPHAAPWRDYRVLAVALLLITAALVATFW